MCCFPIYNATITILTRSIGKAVGERFTLSQIQEAKEEDLEEGAELTKEEEEDAINELIRFRKEKSTSVRFSNKSAARDVRLTVARIEQEVSHCCHCVYS